MNAIFLHDYPLAVETGSTPRPLVKKTWRDSLPIDMLLYAVSVLVVAQSSSEIPEGLMNNPVYRLTEDWKALLSAYRMHVFQMIFARHSYIFPTMQLFEPETQISLCFSITQRYSLVHISHYKSRSIFRYDHARNFIHNADTLTK